MRLGGWRSLRAGSHAEQSLHRPALGLPLVAFSAVVTTPAEVLEQGRAAFVEAFPEQPADTIFSHWLAWFDTTEMTPSLMSLTGLPSSKSSLNSSSMLCRVAVW